MAFNPFLSIGEPVAPVTTEALNPFMMMETETVQYSGDNPFSASNPFSDLGGGFEPAAADPVPVDIFGSADPPAPTSAKQFDTFTSDPSQNIFGLQSETTQRVAKPTELDLVMTTTDSSYTSEIAPPPPRPVPPETQNLILTVTGQMDLTSSHLLDRIPPTRTPSPVSVRDIQSPSITPEPESFEEPAPPAENLDINRNKPARPPPPPPVARGPPPRPKVPPPVPRPPPPKPAPPAKLPPKSDPEEVNLFDAPVPVSAKPTSKDDIMSLYSAPKKQDERQLDFLSDDLPKPSPAVTSKEVSPVSVTEISTATPVEVKKAELIVEETQTEVLNTDAVAPMDCSEPPTEINTALSNSPFSDTGTEIYQDMQSNGNDRNPFETFGAETSPFSAQEEVPVTTSSDIFNTSQNVFSNTAATEVEASKSTNIFGLSDSTNTFDDQAGAFNDQVDAFGGKAIESTDDGWGASAQAFGGNTSEPIDDGWGAPAQQTMAHNAFPESHDAFDAFSAKFESTGAHFVNTAAWGDDASSDLDAAGFESEAFDPFLSMGAPPPPTATPRLEREGSRESTDDNFTFSIRPKEEDGAAVTVPALAPPPRPVALPESPRVNPFDAQETRPDIVMTEEPSRRRGSGEGGETPPTPLFDDDVSMPLEDFPRTTYSGPGWEMHLRQPNKKKITGQRFWKKVFVRLTFQGDNPVIQLLNSATDKEPFQELPLQACYSVSEIGAQQFDQYGKIFTIKLQYVFYKERPGVRPGQVTKAGRITDKLSQFAAYAIQGDYQGVKEFGSDLRKLGLPVEHAPQVFPIAAYALQGDYQGVKKFGSYLWKLGLTVEMSQLFKLGSLSYEDVKQLSCCIEEALFKLPAHRDRALTYKMEEVQITAVDELYAEQDSEGAIIKQIARVRLFFLAFLSGMPEVELGVNDLRRQGREVVGRHDIIPVATEEWIRVENQEFHACVQPEFFESEKIIKFRPPDACYIELMRFRVRPPRNRELPLQLKAAWCVQGNKVELRADVLVPGFASRALGQVPCEDVQIRFPIPECWIYLFRVEKHFRYGSVKSAHRRTGKIKGIERFLGAVDNLQESLIEVTSGQAKYEHQHRSIVWRMPRLPKEGQGAYTTHNLVCRMALTSFDQIPSELAKHAYVEFTMPATQVSHMVVRSVSLQNYDNDPPEKYVRYLARHEYIVGIEKTTASSAPAYALATTVERPEPAPAPAPLIPAAPSSDSDSD